MKIEKRLIEYRINHPVADEYLQVVFYTPDGAKIWEPYLTAFEEWLIKLKEKRENPL